MAQDDTDELRIRRKRVWPGAQPRTEHSAGAPPEALHL